MKKGLVLLLLLWVFLVGPDFMFGEKAPQKIIDLGNNEFIKYGTHQIIVKAVLSENAKEKTLGKVKELDKKWLATPGIDEFMKAMMDSACSKHLQKLQDAKIYISEIFVMDNLGANVAMTDKTSDYWQGDEAKFIKSFNSGKGAVHIGDVKFDSSTRTYSVQISVPVKEGDKVIGAITIGVDVDKVVQ